MSRLAEDADTWACRARTLRVALPIHHENREGKTMRATQNVRLLAVVFGWVGLMASGLFAAETGFQCPVLDVALRASGGASGFPISSADLKIEGAIGLPEFSLVVWTDLDVLPSIVCAMGGQFALTRDWISLSLSAQQGDSPLSLTLRGQATPPSWLLVDGNPTIIGSIAASAEVGLQGEALQSELTLSPSLTGVIPAVNVTVSPSVGIDLAMTSDGGTVNVAGSHLTATVNAGNVLISNTVHFSGVFEAFASLVLSLHVPEWGLTISGSLMPASAGAFSYRLNVSYERGNTYLLPHQTEKPETVCTGGVCF